MNIIVTADKNWGIGYGDKLLVHIPADMKFMRELTEHKVVVMGRKALGNFPNGLPLPKRTNIVLTHNEKLEVPGAVTVHSVEELLEKLKDYDTEEVYVVGGESVFAQLLPYCDTAHVTKIDHAYTADAYVPNLDKTAGWTLAADSDEQTYFDLEYRFLLYKKNES